MLESIRNADGLIIGTPNYLSDVSAGFRALYERLIFQSLTYQKEQMNCNDRRIPVLFIMTSNAPEQFYTPGDDDFAVNLFRLPRGYSLEIDDGGNPYILCPNKEKIYELEKSRQCSETVKFSYMVDGHKRIVRLHMDEKATRDMIFSGENYRSFP